MPGSMEPATTLAQLLDPAKVELEVLRRRHGPLMELPRRMLGVVPNCHPYLEIWPTGLRSYNLLIPNFLDMPLSMWGLSAPPSLVGLAMYTSSRAAECMYCSAHGCTFAMRRGLRAQALTDALDPDSTHTDEERAVIAVARGLSTIPTSLGDGDLATLRRHFSPDHADWILLVVVMMGFLNKCMDTLGIDLEGAVVDDVRGVISSSGWAPGRHEVARDDRPALALGADSLRRKLALLPLLPGAVARERRWTRGVPKTWPAAGTYLEERVGYDFSLLSKIRPPRVIRGLTTALRDNLSPRESQLGLPTKLLAGLVFGIILDDDELTRMSRALLEATAAPVPAARLDAIERWSHTFTNLDDGHALEEELGALGAIDGLDRAAAVALLVAKAASESPSRITPQLLGLCPALSPAATVELVIWLSMLQLLHRASLAFGDGRAAPPSPC